MTYLPPQSPFSAPPPGDPPTFRDEDYWTPVPPELYLPVSPYQPVNPYESAWQPFVPPPSTPRRRWPALRLVGISVLVVAAIVAAALFAVSGLRHSAASGPTLRPAVADTATDGDVFQSKAGHFQARFPVQPDEHTVPESIAGTKIIVVVAATQLPVAEVTMEKISTSVPVDEYQDTMRIALTTLGVPANFTIDSQVESTFRGLPARTATYTTPTLDQLSAVVFFYSGTRLYLLVGETGPVFDELLASFVATP